MKILFVSDLYPVKESEISTPRTLFDFVQAWRRLGHEVSVIKPNFLLNSFVRKKPFYKTGVYDDVYNLNYFTPFWGNVKKKLKGISLNDFDIVIAHMPSGILFADKLGIPFVAGVHVSDIEVLTKPLYSVYFKNRLLKSLRNAKAIACRSSVLKGKLLALYPEFREKTFVAPSGIKQEYIVAQGFKEINPQNLKIMTCANFKRRKNIDKLIVALKDMDGVNLTVVGDGKDRRKLEKLDRNVRFTGRLDKKKVLEEMQNSDVFILPSVNETFGMVYLEAMASGCITICTKNDGIDGIILDGENGFLTEASVDGITTTIQRIKSCNNLAQIRMNSLKTVADYTDLKCARQYLASIHNFLFK